jgi:hypothetical protein
MVGVHWLAMCDCVRVCAGGEEETGNSLADLLLTEAFGRVRLCACRRNLLLRMGGGLGRGGGCSGHLGSLLGRHLHMVLELSTTCAA